MGPVLHRGALPGQAVATVVGAVVLAVAAAFIMLAYRSTGITVVAGYTLTAKFGRVEGIRVGSDVRLSGIKVGSVVAESLEPDTYFAVLTLNIDKNLRLPTDTAAKIETEGLVGARYVAFEPGAEEKFLQPGDQIMHTQSSINLEDLIGRYVFGGSKKKSDGGKTKTPEKSPDDAGQTGSPEDSR